jgi:hypothetical protein
MADFVVCGFKAEYNADKVTEWVEMAPSGEAFDKTRTWHRIKDIRPPDKTDRPDGMSYKVMVARWDIIQPKYDAWKRNEDIPDDGTPLAAWSGVSAEMAAHLKTMGIRTVEGVRDMGEGVFTRLPFPNARQMPKLAGAFLSSIGDAEKDRELTDMRERMAAMEEMLAESGAVKRGPGRPKKEAEAA